MVENKWLLPVISLVGIAHAQTIFERKAAFIKAKELKHKYDNKPILNAGCRETDDGDINLDIVPRQVKNFVLGDISDLSQFKDKTFSVAVASQVLEHVDDPDKAIKELRRVSDEVIIITPYWYNPFAYTTAEHKYLFLPSGKKVKIDGKINRNMLLLIGSILLIMKKK